MELKVWVEGIQRIVCGVTVNTTCQDVVFALAHATGATGRFTLIERWRNNERLLAPHENPLKLLLKWGEYANDVQFILQRSENKHQQQQQQQQQTTGSPNTNNISGTAVDANRNGQENALRSNNSNNNNNNNNRNINNNSNQLRQQQQQLQQKQQATQQIDYNLNSHHYDKSKELRKSFGAHDIKTIDNIGIVRGIPQQQQQQQQQQSNTMRAVKTPTSELSPERMQISPPLQQQHHHQQQQQQQPHLLPRHEKSHSNPIEMSHVQHKNNNNNHNDLFNNYNQFNNNNNNNLYNQIGAQNSKSINEINLAEVRNALDRRVTTTNQQAESMEIMFTTTTNTNTNGAMSNHNNNNNNNNNNNIHDSSEYSNNNNNNNNPSPDQYKNAPAISANGALVPPPYRNPPPPRNSPLQQQTHISHQQQQNQLHNRNTNPFINDYVGTNNNNNNNNNTTNNSNNNMDYQNYGALNNNNTTEESESIFQATQYSDLLQLIKYQREKISAQQMELNKFDAEISFLETKERDQAQELETIAREITKADQVYRQGSEQLQALQYVEEENELVKQQEKTLKSEIALLRSKLANCETELLQCKNKMRLLMDDIEVEQRDITNMQKTNRQNVERDFLMEMERIQSEIDQAIHNTDTTNKTAENLKKEIAMIENAIADKKRQLEQLINEMKEVNLQSLTVTTSEEIKHLLEGPTKPGSTRRIIGSPRQLENAVPTSKNPHGVWV